MKKKKFFITLAPTPWLDGKHTIFGRVNDGMRVVKRMGLVPTDANDRYIYIFLFFFYFYSFFILFILFIFFFFFFLFIYLFGYLYQNINK